MADHAALEHLSWRSRVRQIPDLLSNLLFPPVCANCRRVGALLCDKCLATVPWIMQPLCSRCGRTIPDGVSYCSVCAKKGESILYQAKAAVYFSDPIPRLIHKMKYEGMFALAAPLGDFLNRQWSSQPLPVDLVVPIPLHKERQRKRGYNQSTLLAKQLCTHQELPLCEAALQRTRYTEPQVQLGATERQQNVSGAFTADSELVTGQDILLIDDVYTTGATMRAAAAALQNAGARTVSGYCVARSVRA